jgi:hypothetical protein
LTLASLWLVALRTVFSKAADEPEYSSMLVTLVVLTVDFYQPHWVSWRLVGKFNAYIHLSRHLMDGLVVCMEVVMDDKVVLIDLCATLLGLTNSISTPESTDLAFKIQHCKHVGNHCAVLGTIVASCHQEITQSRQELGENGFGLVQGSRCGCEPILSCAWGCVQQDGCQPQATVNMYGYTTAIKAYLPSWRLTLEHCCDSLCWLDHLEIVTDLQRMTWCRCTLSRAVQWYQRTVAARGHECS